MMNSAQGIGMTSQRTRDRMIHRLREKGIINENVLKAMSKVPRHLFMDEALSHQAFCLLFRNGRACGHQSRDNGLLCPLI